LRRITATQAGRRHPYEATIKPDGMARVVREARNGMEPGDAEDDDVDDLEHALIGACQSPR